MKQKLACKESIADLWGCPDAKYPKKPETSDLFKAIGNEALACLSHTDWETSIRRIENILAVIRERMHMHWESWHESELEKKLKKKRDPWDCDYPGCDIPADCRCPGCGKWLCENHIKHECNGRR